MYHKSVQTEPEVSDSSTSTDDLDLEPVPFSIEQIKTMIMMLPFTQDLHHSFISQLVLTF